MQNPQTFYKNYELWDSGDGRRLEKFGQYLVERPAPQAQYDKKLDAFIWGRADFIFSDGVWRDKNDRELDQTKTWNMEIDNISIRLSLSAKGQVGIFPEQFTNWEWMYQAIDQHLVKDGADFYSDDKKFTVLNAFAYTGLASIFSARASRDFPSEICHLDGSSSAVNWAAENARMNGLDNIRWIIDDVISFLRRELKRGKFYNAMILDPPAFGRGKKKTWSFKKDIQDLLELSKELLSPAGPLFFLLSCHESGISKRELRDMVACALSIPIRFIESMDLEIDSLRGNPLSCGISIRFKKP